MLNIKFIGTVITGVFLGAIGSYVYLERKRKKELLEVEEWEKDLVNQYTKEDKETLAATKLGRTILNLEDDEETDEVVKEDEVNNKKTDFDLDESDTFIVEPNTPGIEILKTFGDIEDSDDWTTDILFFDSNNNVLDSDYEPLSNEQQVDIIGAGTLEYLIARAEYTTYNVFYLRNSNLQLSIELYYYDSLEDEGMIE